MSRFTNREIADFLAEFAVLLELNGENAFRIRAYTNGARLIENLSTEIADLVDPDDPGKLTSIKGIGKGLADLIAEYFLSGSSQGYASGVPWQSVHSICTEPRLAAARHPSLCTSIEEWQSWQVIPFW